MIEDELFSPEIHDHYVILEDQNLEEKHVRIMLVDGDYTGIEYHYNNLKLDPNPNADGVYELNIRYDFDAVPDHLDKAELQNHVAFMQYLVEVAMDIYLEWISKSEN